MERINRKREKVGEEKVEEFRELLYEAPLDVVLGYSRMMELTKFK